MQQLNKVIILSITFLLSFALTGCSGEPSISDIEKAIKATVDQATQQAKSVGGSMISDDMLPKVYEVKKLGCAAAQDASGYNCDVEVDSSAPFIGRNKRVSKIRFVKGSDGWVITE